MKRLKVYLAVLANVLVLNGFTQVDCTNVTSTICNGTAALYHLNVDPATIVWHGMGIVPKIHTQYGDFNRTNLCPGAYTVTYTTYDGVPMVVSFSIANSAGMYPCGGLGVNISIYPPEVIDCYGSLTANPWNGQCGNMDGNPPFSYVWSTGQTTPHITYLCPGKYVVVQTDSIGCAFGESATINWFTGPGMPWIPYWYHLETQELSENDKTIIKVTDIMGRECALDAGELRIVLYSDGTIKKVIAN
jgi:hypothetical protein